LLAILLAGVAVVSVFILEQLSA